MFGYVLITLQSQNKWAYPLSSINNLDDSFVWFYFTISKYEILLQFHIKAWTTEMSLLFIFILPSSNIKYWFIEYIQASSSYSSFPTMYMLTSPSTVYTIETDLIEIRSISKILYHHVPPKKKLHHHICMRQMIF